MDIVKENDIKKMRKLSNYEMIEKEELKKLYVDERKSMIVISKIYKCSVITIKRRLIKYDILIRSHNAFLIDNDGKTLKFKRVKDDYLTGYDSPSSKLSRGEITDSEYRNDLANRRGYKDYKEYHNANAKKRGYKDDNDRRRQEHYIKDGSKSMSENKDCSAYLGVYIAERILPKIFNDVKMMPRNNRGFDAICNKNLKIEVKSACLRRNKEWTFGIHNNKIADYFFIVSFDNREDLNVMHMWLIKGNSNIKSIHNYNGNDYIFNEKYAIDIGKGKKSLEKWKSFEITDKLDDVQKICNEFKNNEKCILND